ncbi:hypothetical protein [Shigella dysenteriae]|uniref:hypothetical protein n=1 Tax=Shigella dysenteriae TaxID=622 RepID=UPI0014939C66|nr:hypothetical protein [Shigella dysenteriae]WNT50148.1 hypothetical protein PWP84_17290 [Shigella dysenteriae]
MNVNAGHERTSKARIIHQIQLIRGITKNGIIINKRKQKPPLWVSALNNRHQLLINAR